MKGRETIELVELKESFNGNSEAFRHHRREILAIYICSFFLTTELLMCD